MIVVLQSFQKQLLPTGHDVFVTCRHTLKQVLECVCQGVDDSDGDIDLNQIRRKVYFRGEDIIQKTLVHERPMNGQCSIDFLYDVAVQDLPLDCTDIVDDIYDLHETLTRFPPTIHHQTHIVPISEQDALSTIGDDGIIPFFCMIRWILARSILLRATDNNNQSCALPFPYEEHDSPVYLYGGGCNASQTFGSYAAYAALTGHLQNNRSIAGSSMGSLIAAAMAEANDTHVVYNRLLETARHPRVEDRPVSNESFTYMIEGILGGAHVADMTLLSFYEKTRRRVDFLVTDVLAWEPVAINYMSHPSMTVRKAIQASCGIPFVTGLCRVGDRIFCDGDATAGRYLAKCIPGTYHVAIDVKYNANVDRCMFSGIDEMLHVCSRGSPFVAIVQALCTIAEEFNTSRYPEHQHVFAVPFDMSNYERVIGGTCGNVCKHASNYMNGFEWTILNYTLA
jgi:hypothetical protein